MDESCLLHFNQPSCQCHWPIFCGRYKGEVILLPRIPLIPSDSELPFWFCHLQFPCKPCFSMSINKLQGQTFKAIGVDLSVPCFTHGQLYVAASPACSTSKLCIFVPKDHTSFVVYPETLQNWRKVYNASWFLYFIGNGRSFVYILIVLCIPRAKLCTSATYYDWIIQINYLFKICLFSDSLLT